MSDAQWPFQLEDRVCANTGRIELSNGMLLSTTISYALQESAAPRHELVPCKTGPHGYSRIYKWGDILEWLTAKGISAIGPRPPREEYQITHTTVPRDYHEDCLQKAQVGTATLEQRITDLQWQLTHYDFSRDDFLLSGEEIVTAAVPVSAHRTVGIYFLIDREEIVYVGQSGDIVARLRQHWRDPTKKFEGTFIVRCPERQLDMLEQAYIQKFRPRYNIAWKPQSSSLSVEG